MDRRTFLIKSVFSLCGSLLGLNSFSKVFALENPHGSSNLKPHIAIIIDDIGYSLSAARQFLKPGIPITFAVLPRLRNSYNLAMELRYKGHEIMLHQPMEPFNSEIDPGPGALYVGYDRSQILGIMDENIASIPYVIGVNNHMGSKFTTFQKEIKEALKVVKQKRLFFVDSLTSGYSKAYRTARKLHISSAYRNIFLDNTPDESAIVCQLYRLQQHALKYGRAVGIGHPYPETAQAINKFVRNVDRYDVTFVHASNILLR